MATEALIRSKAKKELEKEGYHVWCPAKAKYIETDIFGVFDAVAIKDSHIRYIQWTSLKNIRAREKKIRQFFEDKRCFVGCEVWGYDQKKGEFKKIII